MGFTNRVLFNLWYFLSPPWDTGRSPPELVEFIKSHLAGRALDLGCGTGTNSITLAKADWQVVGIDFASRAIREGRKKARRAGVQVDLHVGDVTDIENITGKFDLILDIGCFHSLSKQNKLSYIRNLNQLLAENGSFLCYAFFKSPGKSGSGLLPSDLENLSKNMRLVRREDGTERGQHPSVWLTYQHSHT